MAKVLVTGASGFIGQHLVETLVARGDEVSCLVRCSSAVDRLRDLKVQLAQGDVTDPESLRLPVAKADVVYHLAGLTKATSARDMFQVNAQGTGSVLAACAAQPSPPVTVLVSSLAAAGPSTIQRPRIESDRPQPVSIYGRSKLAGELAAIAWADKVPLTILRPPIVYGAGDVTGTLSLFKPIARARIHAVPGSGRSRFSLIHANDLATAIILAAERGRRVQSAHVNGNGHQAAGGTYFVAGDGEPTYVDLGRMIGEAVGHRQIVIWPWNGTLFLLPLAAGAEVLGRLRGRPFALNLDKAREANAGSWTCSSRALRGDTGFAPAVPLSAGLRQTVEWYRRHGWL